MLFILCSFCGVYITQIIKLVSYALDWKPICTVVVSCKAYICIGIKNSKYDFHLLF